MSRIREIMTQKRVDCLLVVPSVNFHYLLEYTPFSDERLLCMLLPRDDEPFLIAPRLQVTDLETHIPGIQIREWADGEDPYCVLAASMRERGLDSATIAVDPWLRSVMLLNMIERMPSCRYVTGDAVLGEARTVKAKHELDCLRRASSLADAVMNEVFGLLREGMSELDVVGLIQRAFAMKGAGRLSFDPIIGSGPNSAFPHHTSGERRLQAGDALIMDFGGSFQGYPSDITRTVFIGEPTPIMREVYEVVLEAQEAAFQRADPGIPAQEVDRAARRVIESQGYGEFFIHRTGHGIGLEVHELPSIEEGNMDLLAEGMVFSVEPGIYLPGQFGVRIEDLVEITCDGARRLNSAARDLKVLALAPVDPC
ncbi:MAG: aminopeptidase P family protein [Bacillota bacterium]